MTLDPRDLAALKPLFVILVDKLGKRSVAAQALDWSESNLSEVCALHRPDRMPRVDHVARLEAMTGEPLITQHLARMAGHVLAPLPRAEASAEGALSQMLVAAGGLVSEAAKAMADGTATEAERRLLLREIAALRRALDGAEAALVRRD